MRSPTVTPKLQRIAAQAAREPTRVFTTLTYLIAEDFLREAYRHTSKSSAPGIDGVTAEAYAEHLDENLRDLHERLRSGRYQAAPVERVWIENEDDAGRIQEAQSQSGSGTWERHIRVSRLHPLLGTNTSGILGYQTQNSQETAPADSAGAVAMVSPQPPCASAIPVSNAVREATRTLSVLRDSRQLPSAGERPSLCGEGVAVLVESA